MIALRVIGAGVTLLIGAVEWLAGLVVLLVVGWGDEADVARTEEPR